MKKQIASVLALILLLSAFWGCSNSLLTDNSLTTTATSVITTQNATEKETQTAASKTATETTTAKTTTAQKKETTKITTAKTTVKKTENKTHTQTQNYCYITIECKSVLDNMDNLKEGHEDFVPSNGIILGKTKCTFEKNASVYDVLKKACNNKGIKLSARDTVYGVYVSGINNLDEFDCSQQSGWVYTVNGSSPSVSCGKFTVSKGDEIIFKYVC